MPSKQMTGFPLLTGIRGSAGVSRGPTEAITGPPRYISGVQPVMPGVQFGPLDPCRETPAETAPPDPYVRSGSRSTGLQQDRM